MKSMITEIMGGLASLDKYGQSPIAQRSEPFPITPGPVSGAHPGSMWQPGQSVTGIQLKNCAQLYAWQGQIVQQLMRGEDAFIITDSPGGGKTLPVIAFWAEKILGINPTLNPNVNINVVLNNALTLIKNPEKIPQILWLCPIRSLNEQTVQDEFTKDFTEIILQYINYIQWQIRVFITNLNPASQRDFITINSILYDLLHSMTNDISVHNQLDFMKNQKYDLVINQYNTATDDLIKASIVSKINNLDAEFFQLLENIVRDFINRKLIGMKYEGQNLSTEQRQSIPVIISIYESAGSEKARLVRDMPRLALMVFDEIQTAQLSGANDPATDARAKQIATNIHEILSTQNAKKAQLVMLSGTENEKTAIAQVQFYNVAYNRRFKAPIVTNARNAANIRVQDFDQLNDFWYIKNKLIKELLASKETGIAFIILSKNKIREIADYCSGGSGQEISQPTKTEVGRKRPYFQPKDVDIVAGEASASNIGDPLLRKAVASGIGFMYRIEPSDPNYSFLKNDNAIVQELFRKGKVRILLATEYIGSGLNVNIKQMYIPSIERFGGEKIPIGPLSQLLNRVGRQPIDCVIYTPSDNVDYIIKALNAKNIDFNYVPPIMPTLGSKVKYYGNLTKSAIVDPVKMLARILIS